MKKYFLLASLLVMILFGILLVLIFPSNQAESPSPSITPAPTNPGEETTGISGMSAQDKINIDKNRKKGDILNLLPYHGKFFTFDFDYSKNVFVLTLSKNNIQEGNQEFDNFIKSNGITDRTWFSNLVVNYQ